MSADTFRKRIAVTGTTGFFGGKAALHLTRAGYKVFSCGRKPPESVAEELRDNYIQWDIANGALADAPKVDAVVHCAAKVTDWGQSKDFISANIIGTRNVVATWPDARFVHISTASVYPDHCGGTLVETDVDPLTLGNETSPSWLSKYAKTKRSAEYEVASQHTNFAILRPHLIYGPDDRQMAPRLLERVRRGKLFIPGDGTDVRLSVTHLDNLLHAVDCAVASSAVGAFNISDGYVPTVQEAIDAMLNAVGCDAKIVYIPRSATWAVAPLIEWTWSLTRRESSPPATRFTIAHIAWDHILDLKKAREQLGFSPSEGFPDSFKTISIAHDLP